MTGRTTRELARLMRLRPDVARELLEAMRREGLVERVEGVWTATERARELFGPVTWGPR